MNPNNDKKLIGAGVVAAVAASLCCITPVLAFLSGAAGLASTLSWMEPFRPLLIALTIGVLGFAWYQKLKPLRANDVQCACEEGEKTPFLQTRSFLGLVTIFASVMLAFPYYESIFYGSIFYPANAAQTVVVPADQVETVAYQVSGMTCSSCEAHVKHGITEVPGVIDASADAETGEAVVRFNRGQTDAEAIRRAIDATGYKVTGTGGAMSEQSPLDSCCVLPAAGSASGRETMPDRSIPAGVSVSAPEPGTGGEK